VTVKQHFYLKIESKKKLPSLAFTIPETVGVMIHLLYFSVYLRKR